LQNNYAIGDEYAIIKEGETKLAVPKESLLASSPPRKPVFYNPRGKRVRDISILAYSAISIPNMIYGEALTGSGARLVRVANEVKNVESAYGNDLNEEAVRVAGFSARLNKRENITFISNKNANLFLAENAERFDVVDIDPFGSPVNYVENALRAVRFGGMLSITATDTAPLKGLYNKVAFRRYFGTSVRCDFSNEIALRLLSAMVIREGMQMDFAAEVAFAHSDLHYMRLYFFVNRGIEEANKLIEKLGYIRVCSRCYFRKEVRLDAWDEYKLCPRCMNKTDVAGPLWLGNIFNAELVKGMIDKAKEKGMMVYVKFLERAMLEMQSPAYYYRIPSIADRMNKKAPSPLYIVERLRESGYKATLTSLDSQGVKTDAPIEAVEESLSVV
jgi:tRNA (guanine26-N2/guanine27-N2)-dimethyltransferase